MKDNPGWRGEELSPAGEETGHGVLNPSKTLREGFLTRGYHLSLSATDPGVTNLGESAGGKDLAALVW